MMTGKISRSDFIEILKKKTGCQSDEAFGELLGVTKQSVSHWKSGKGQIPFDRFLKNFGQETLEWIKQEYDLDVKKSDQGSEELLKEEAKKIQLLFDRGLVKIPSAVSQPEVQTENKGCCTCEDCFEVPLYVHRVAAGLPADSTCQAEKIALPAILVKHPKATYAVTVSGDSMKGAGIEEGDILIVDKAIEPANKSIVIASINGEQTVKRLQIKKGAVSLMPENHKYPEIPITPDMDFRTLGVVTWVIRKTG
jgi:DNA polymerase V